MKTEGLTGREAMALCAKSFKIRATNKFGQTLAVNEFGEVVKSINGCTSWTPSNFHFASEPYSVAIPDECRHLFETNGRQLEPTPGWCERAYELLRMMRREVTDYGLINPCDKLVGQYRAAAREAREIEAVQKQPEPRTYTATEAERLCRERPEEVEAINKNGLRLRFNRVGGFEFWSTCGPSWQGSGHAHIAFAMEFEPFTLREAKAAEPQTEPLGHEWKRRDVTETLNCARCKRPFTEENRYAPCPARAQSKPEPQAEQPAAEVLPEERLHCILQRIPRRYAEAFRILLAAQRRIAREEIAAAVKHGALKGDK